MNEFKPRMLKVPTTEITIGDLFEHNGECMVVVCLNGTLEAHSITKPLATYCDLEYYLKDGVTKFYRPLSGDNVCTVARHVTGEYSASSIGDIIKYLVESPLEQEIREINDQIHELRTKRNELRAKL